MRAEDFLNAGLGRISQAAEERDAPNGERSMLPAVRNFKALRGIDLSESDGWVFMIALKLARASQGGYHEEDYVDLVGYSALLAEAVAAEHNRLNKVKQINQEIEQGGYVDTSMPLQERMKNQRR